MRSYSVDNRMNRREKGMLFKIYKKGKEVLRHNLTEATLLKIKKIKNHTPQ